MVKNVWIIGSGIIKLFLFGIAISCYADTITINGYTYTYQIDGPGVRLQNCSSEDWDNNTKESTPAISPLPSGDFVLPATIKGTKVWHIGANAFRGCTNLTSLTIPDGPTMSGVSIGVSVGESSFEGCTALTNVVFSSSTGPIYSRAFASCTALTTFEFPESICFIAEGILSNCTSLASVLIPEKCMRIESNAFFGCVKLEKINIPNEVQSINVSAFQGAFESSSLPDGLVFMGNWLLGCKGRTSRQLIIPEGNWKFPSVMGPTADQEYWEVPFLVSENLKNHDPCELVINGCFGHDSELPGSFPVCSDGITSVTVGSKISRLSYLGLGSTNRLENLTILGNISSYQMRSYRGYNNLTLHGNPYSLTPFNMLATFSTNTLVRLYQRDPRNVKNLCIKIYLSSLDKNYTQMLKGTTDLVDVLRSQALAKNENDKDVTDIEYICQTLDKIRYVNVGRSSYGTEPIDSSTRSLLIEIERNVAGIGFYFYHIYGHPSGAYQIALDAEMNSDRVKSAQYYQKAAIGYAKNLCLFTKKGDVGLGFTSSSPEGEILNCIRAINSLGFSKVAEKTLLETQAIQEQVNTDSEQEAISDVAYGTGWACNSKYIVTCWHVVKGYESIVGLLKDGREIPLSLHAKDEASDIAILKILDDKTTLPALPIARSSAKSSEKVFTMGYPMQHLLGGEQKFTDGSISATSGLFDDRRFYQISVPLQPGNSGGPLLSQTGAVTGITAAGLDAIATLAKEGTLPQNVNYAIKVRYLQNLLDDIGISYSLCESTNNDFPQIVEKVSRSVLVVRARNILQK